MEHTKQLLVDILKDVDCLKDNLKNLENMMNLAMKGDICDKFLTDWNKSNSLKMHELQNSVKMCMNQCSILRNIEMTKKTKNETDLETDLETPANTKTNELTMQDFCDHGTFDMDSLTQRLKIVQQSKKTNTKVESQFAAIPEPALSTSYCKYLQKRQLKYISKD